MDQTITINPDGSIAFVWSDELAGLRDEGAAHITRASHVEPTPDGQWMADMSPSIAAVRSMRGGRKFRGAVTLGPFPLRQQALDAERAWLAQYLGV